MAKQPYFVDSSQKQMDVEGSFGGGMVTQAHPEKLRDDQLILVENADIVAGGVVQARGGYSQSNAPSSAISGNVQGKFKYQNIAGGQDLIAINGKLYTISGNTYTALTITGLTNSTFQSTRNVGSVQYRDKLYFATGSGLVVYDGTTASLVTAYAPTGLEALYIGTNGYAANPDTYLSDTTGAADVILGVTASTRYGVINQNITFTAYIQKVTVDTLEYQFETKQVVSADYTVVQAWGSSKTWTGNFSTKADYMIRVSMRKTGTTVTLSQYVIPRYKVNTTPDEKPEPGITFTNMSTCNRIFIHYDRMFMYGDSTNPDFLYISHLNKFDYWPRTNIIKVTDPLRGSLQKVVQYKNFLVCITDGSIQGIQGKSPADYDKFPIHTTLGTKNGDSVQVMKNYITFVGNDNGVYVLKSFTYAADDKLNVDRLDVNIMDVVSGLLKTATRVLSAIYNNQYYLYIENSGGNYIYRYYFELGVWVRDSTSLSFRTMDNDNNVLTTTSLTGGTVYKLSTTVFRDGTATAYNMRLLSKDYNFGYPHHRKKLKQYQILAKMTAQSGISVGLYLDNNLLSTTMLNYDATQNTDAQKLKLMASGRFRYVKTDIQVFVNEAIQITGFTFVYKLNNPK